MNVITERGGHRLRVPIKCWTDGVPVEEAAVDQLARTALLPFVRAVAVMPDVHVGLGATVGSVVATKGAIVPAAVGVDIGCSVSWCRTALVAADLPDSLAGLRSRIEAAVPHGRTNRGQPGDAGAWSDPPADVVNTWVGEQDATPTIDWTLRDILTKHPKIVGMNPRNTVHHLGTLGTGNHFIEVVLDDEDRVGILLHSGSRGIGNRIGTYFIERAREEMKTWYVDLPDPDLAYLPERSSLFADYLDAVEWAQRYADANHRVMMARVLECLGRELDRGFLSHDDVVHCRHNYVAREHHGGENVLVTRKGAVRARLGDLGLIPGSMGARSYVVRGLGNPESLTSCSHGAGRCMSRGEARRRISLADHEAATVGVECRKDVEVLDESPAAYKSIDAVMSAQRDLVEVVHTLRQIVCVKG